MNKDLIKDTIKEMIRDGDISIVFDNVVDMLKYSEVKYCVDVENILKDVNIRLVVNDDTPR